MRSTRSTALALLAGLALTCAGCDAQGAWPDLEPCPYDEVDGRTLREAIDGVDRWYEVSGRPGIAPDTTTTPEDRTVAMLGDFVDVTTGARLDQVTAHESTARDIESVRRVGLRTLVGADRAGYVQLAIATTDGSNLRALGACSDRIVGRALRSAASQIGGMSWAVVTELTELGREARLWTYLHPVDPADLDWIDRPAMDRAVDPAQTPPGYLASLVEIDPEIELAIPTAADQPYVCTWSEAGWSPCVAVGTGVLRAPRSYWQPGGRLEVWLVGGAGVLGADRTLAGSIAAADVADALDGTRLHIVVTVTGAAVTERLSGG